MSSLLSNFFRSCRAKKVRISSSKRIRNTLTINNKLQNDILKYLKKGTYVKFGSEYGSGSRLFQNPAWNFK